MNKSTYLLLALFAVMTLGACNHSGNGGGPVVDNTGSDIAQLADQSADSESVTLNADDLSGNISGIFGDEDATPTDVLANDSVSDVINRANGG